MKHYCRSIAEDTSLFFPLEVFGVKILVGGFVQRKGGGGRSSASSLFVYISTLKREASCRHHPELDISHSFVYSMGQYTTDVDLDGAGRA